MAAVVIGAQFFAVSAAAKRFPISRDQPVATVDIPDAWRPTPAPNGVEGVGLEGAVRLIVEFVSSPGADGAVVEAIKQLAERGVVVAPETRRTAPRHFNGSDGLKIDFSGTDPNEELDVTLILVASTRKPGFVSICYWGDDEALESVSNEIQSIADSIELTK